jgi:hypothetical protein
MISKPAARVAQAQPDDATEIKTAKQHTRDLFAWLNQVASDHDLPSSAFKVAYIIGNYVNRQSGDAWPSSARIARDCALSQPTVVAMTARLKAAGHLAVEPGSAGRGHLNRYRMILKHQPTDALVPLKHRPADASASRKASGSRVESIRPEQIKHQPADMNILKNNLQNHQERAGGPRSADDDRLSIASNSAKTADDAPLSPAFATADDAAICRPSESTDLLASSRCARR